jgi:hypothetical protein
MRWGFGIFVLVLSCGATTEDAGSAKSESESDVAPLPRSNRELDRLALMVDRSKLTADQATYDRVVRDVNLIRSIDANAAAVRGPVSSSRLDVELNAAGAEALRNDAYHEWDVLNDRYHMAIAGQTVGTQGAQVTLQTKGIYNLRQVALEYRKLWQVVGASASGPEDSGVATVSERICVRAGTPLTRAEGVYSYLFETSWDGDDGPPRVATWFAVSAAGEILESHRWTSDEPQWLPSDVEAICDYRESLPPVLPR